MSLDSDLLRDGRLSPGSAIGGYRIDEFLGKGGMGEVYAAKNGDGTLVALKVFSSERVKSHFLRERFVAEGRILARLSHPRLVSVFDSGVDDVTGRPYYVMQLVRDGSGRATTLHDVCANGKVTEARAERWYGDLCDVLAYCHSHGVVHRDVKLGNILLDSEDHAVLSDFGVSRIIEPDLREELKLGSTFVTGETTGTRPVIGSYWYLAPEVRRGEAATAASDWYALGVLFFRLLTGMWYEPGTAALDLLAPYDPKWRRRLEALLSEDPAKRCAVGAGGNSVSRLARGTGCAGKRRMGWLLAVVGILAFALCEIALVRIDSGMSDSKMLPLQNLILPLDVTNRFVFCPCPVGTNAYRKQSVAVTRPYWLGSVPVTRRQYFAVVGKPLVSWYGGEDAPMTYLSREEVTNFCALLNRRFASSIPKGCEIRLPTLAEWQLAYVQGKTVPLEFPDSKALRSAYMERGWYGQGVNGEPKRSNMRRHYEQLNHPIPLVTNIWKEFPPRIINPGRDGWTRASSQFPPVPVGLKPANSLGLHDMLGNCYERVYDTCSSNCHHWGKTEWGATTIGLYGGQGLALTNPVERAGSLPLMVGTYLAPDLAGDRVWSADFERLPHLGFRLCIGPKL